MQLLTFEQGALPEAKILSSPYEVVIPHYQ